MDAVGLGGVGRVRRNCGEGAREGAIGRRRVDGGGVVASVSLGFEGGVVGSEKAKSGKRPGGRRYEGVSWWYGRRRDVHSVQVNDMFKRENGAESILCCKA